MMGDHSKRACTRASQASPSAVSFSCVYTVSLLIENKKIGRVVTIRNCGEGVRDFEGAAAKMSG